jgi:hypothetical protein
MLCDRSIGLIGVTAESGILNPNKQLAPACKQQGKMKGIHSFHRS